jgi:hypothetical protein
MTDTRTRTDAGRTVDGGAGRAVSVATTCRCGQQLDCCARSHCPRCGRAVTTRTS